MMNTTILDETFVGDKLFVKYYDEQLDDVITFELPTKSRVMHITKINFNTYMIKTETEQFMVY